MTIVIEAIQNYFRVVRGEKKMLLISCCELLSEKRCT